MSATAVRNSRGLFRMLTSDIEIYPLLGFVGLTFGAAGYFAGVKRAEAGKVGEIEHYGGAGPPLPRDLQDKMAQSAPNANMSAKVGNLVK
ncbi:hypothetical protein IWQ60_000614 [Tieghemiomyces parasiticus]|uniref:Uncharacterized protein n=1 Tax=Tieghemiomyces parasiticus TaxID=78921 RepID=A0A9W8AKS9_9FUNG|nr:hypothetical protein IWQ60_000614 [Tieghemiomyces parasiticus]